jgi:hypothetical protein
VSELQAASDLTDDQITALISDPAKIETHEMALEVIGVLDAEIANIQTQIDAATIEANIRPLSSERQSWLKRASYAAAMRRNERHKVYQRDKELRGLKGRAFTEPKHTKEEKALKQQRLLVEAETRRASKQLALSQARAREMELAQQSRELKAQISMVPEMIRALRAYQYADDNPEIESAASIARSLAQTVLDKLDRQNGSR